MVRLLVGILLISIVLNIWLFYTKPHASPVQKQQPDTSFADLEKRYPLLSKRILNDFPNDLLISFLPLRKELHQAISQYDDKISLYFEYLPTGTSIQIHATQEYPAASLLKVPVIMAYYYYHERVGDNINREVALTKEMLDSSYGDLYKKGEGARISLFDAIKKTLIDSDNTALHVVSANTPQQDFDTIYNGLDLDLTVKDDALTISTEQYAAILKSLYFSSTLTKDDSNTILTLLTQTHFHDMLPASIPSSVPIAHKIGEAENKVFSDCGIVYVPRRGYLLCMVSESDKKTAQARMADLSKKVYMYVTNAQLLTNPNAATGLSQ